MAISYIASSGQGAHASSTSVTTAGAATTGANFGVVFITMDNGTLAATPVQDSQGNTWTAVGTTYSSSGRSITCYYTMAASGAGSGHTVTANRTTSGGISIATAWFSGVKTTSALDGNAPQGNADVFKTTLAASAALTPTEDSEVVVSGCYHQQASATQNDGTLTIAVNHDGSNEESIALAYVVQSTATAVNPTWSGGSESIYMGVMNVAFKAGAVVDPVILPPRFLGSPRPFPFRPGTAKRPW